MIAARRSLASAAARSRSFLAFTVAGLMFLTLPGTSRLAAEEMGEFSFELLPDGTPRFTQVFRWEANPDVLFYEVTLQTLAGEEISVSRLKEPVLKLDLRPGGYRFRIVLYNLLGRPELELPWRNFTVRKAEIPRVTAVSPKAWYTEDLIPELTIMGDGLAPGATIVLKRAAAGAAPITGTEKSREGTAAVSVEFPLDAISAGEYFLELTNPGGLSFIVPAAIIVGFRPVDFLFSAGYAPWVSLYDAQYIAIWPGPAFPLGAAARFSVYFIKGNAGFFGVAMEASGRFMQGGDKGATINSEIGLAGIDGIYKYPFTPKIAATAGIGGGIAFSHHQFDFEGAMGAEIYSMDLFLSAGVSLQYYLTKYLYLEAGTAWMHMFTNGYSGGGLMPFLCVGVRF